MLKFYGIVNKQKPILSGKVCQALNLIQRVYKLDESLQELLNLHPSGAMTGTYFIKIDPTVKHVVHGPRRQPAALLPKLKEKLKEMNNEGHLAKVTQPADWVSSMVVSTHRDKIRICLDLDDLNKAVTKEH